MEKIMCVILAFFCFLLWLLMMFKGKKYVSWVENLDDKEYPLKEMYSVGFAWQYMIPQLSYTGEFAQKIRSDIALYYGEEYMEYYCRVTLAQIYTFVHMFLCFCLCIGCITEGSTSLLMILVGIGASIAIVDNYRKEPAKKVQKRADACMEQFPNMVSKLALLINSGMILREAWFEITKTSKAQLHDLMQETCDAMENGVSDVQAIHDFGMKSANKEMKKFANVVISGIEKGNSQLADMLIQQTSELWDVKRQRMLQKGEEIATKLVVPVTMMFVGLLIVIVSSVLSGMSI